jgi:23S rRNA (cytosine1962-C5)-methyltransferase
VYEEFREIAARFFASPQTDTRRILHGRGHLFDGLEHLCVDWFPPVVLITTYGNDDQPEDLNNILLAADQHKQIESIQMQYRKRKGVPSINLSGDQITKCIVNEGDLVFEVQPGVNQNAGLFLDMRPLRERLQAGSRDKNVLNLFAYTCSLSVAALAGGARQVVNVDMSKPSINWGMRNHELNNQDLRAVRSVPHNLFRSWGRIKQSGPYDLILIDPPTRQRGSFDAEKNYPSVIKKLPQLAAPGAEVIATINSPYLGDDYLINLFARYAPQYRFRERLPAAPEFEDQFPEKALKIYRFSA